MKDKLLALLVCLYCYTGWAQVEPQVDFVTGTASVTIPLYTIQEKELQFPIALRHAANGVRLEETDGWVGQDWNISVDAMINREVRGLPDDYLATGTYPHKGWLQGDMGTRVKNYTFTTDNNPATCTDETANWTFLNGFQYQDTEPDVFSVNVPGLSFQFYFDENKQYHVVPYQDVQITYTTDPATSQIASFTVIDSNGIKYIFQDGEKVTRSALISTFSDYNLRRKASFHDHLYTPYNALWRITSIVSPVYGHIDFTYTDVPINDELIGGARYNLPLKIHSDWHAYDNILSYNSQFTKKLLQRITTSTSQFDFSSSDAPYIRLNLISVSEIRSGTPVLIKQFDFDYVATIYYTDSNADVVKGKRAFLTALQEKTPSEQNPPYTFEYNAVDQYGHSPLPFVETNFANKDAWSFYTGDITAGTLKKINFPLGGYTVLFYDPHQYLDKTTNTPTIGGGVRVRKIVSHDGIATASDLITEYEYLDSNGQTSGRLQYKPKRTLTTVYLDYLIPNGNWIYNLRYRDVQQMVSGGTLTGPPEKFFTLTANQDLAFEETLNESAVAYERIAVKRSGAGKKIYEFDLPAMEGDLSANNGEWEASAVSIARSSTGTSVCYETGNIQLGLNQFPYPRHPNYNFARGLLKKVTDVNEQGSTVREVSYDYQRLYAGTGIRKIYALAFEDLYTYYYNGTSYVDGRMFLYGKYAINTDVKTVLKTETETVYNSSDVANNFQTVTSYYYESPSHREVTKVVKRNSDQNQFVTRLKYAKDYTIGTPTDNTTIAIAGLLADHRTSTIIETTSSYIKNNIENYTAAGLSLFQQVNGKTVPFKQFAFQSTDGTTSFTPSGIQTVSGNSTFQFDQANYVLTGSYLKYDNQWNLAETVGRHKQIKSVAWGYTGTLPVLSVNNAHVNEVAFSDFETASDINFSLVGFPAIYFPPRTGSKSIGFPSSSGSKLVKTIANNQSKKYIFSCWINAPTTPGNITIKLKNGPTDLITPVQVPFAVFSGFKYYSIMINTSALPASFDAEISTSTDISVDDMAFYPAHATISACVYNLPFGKSAETDTRGVTTYYTYDEWGRIKLVKDQDQNIRSKYDFHIRP